MIELYDYQKSLKRQTEEALSRSNKAVLNGICGIGKTYITLCMIRDWISAGKRVLVFTYSQNNIKEQWVKSIVDKNVVPSGLFSVLCSNEHLKKIKSGGCLISEIPNNPLLITIPQTAYRNIDKLGKFDYIVIDEAHAYLDTEDDNSMIKKIIRGCSKKDTNILGLTATAFDLISEGGFFHDMPIENCIIYDIEEAMNNKNIAGLDIEIVKFNFDIDKEFYNNKGNLTRTGEKLVRCKTHSAKKVDDILSKVKGKTIIITVPLQDQDLYDYINMKFGNGCCVLNTQRSEDDKAEDKFKNDKNVKFMIVIQKCGVGWDFPELQNVVDLTFTKNHKSIIQRMLRPCRNFGENKIGNYFYCIDQSRSDDVAIRRISTSVWLSRKEGIHTRRNDPNAECIELFKPKTKKGLIGGSKINVKDLISEYNIVYDRLVVEKFELRAKKDCSDDFMNALTWIERSNLVSRQRLGDVHNISQTVEEFRYNLNKYLPKIYSIYKNGGFKCWVK